MIPRLGSRTPTLQSEPWHQTHWVRSLHGTGWEPTGTCWTMSKCYIHYTYWCIRLHVYLPQWLIAGLELGSTCSVSLWGHLLAADSLSLNLRRFVFHPSSSRLSALFFRTPTVQITFRVGTYTCTSCVLYQNETESESSQQSSSQLLTKISESSTKDK